MKLCLRALFNGQMLNHTILYQKPPVGWLAPTGFLII